jgi:hypothetical protein
MKPTTIMVFAVLLFGYYSNAQKVINYNLADLLKNKQLLTDTSTHTQLLNDKINFNGISTKKIAWLKDVSFAEGTIDIDLRGRDVFLQSFLGVAFHAADSNHYELIYFRPFNFQYPDTARRRWSLQYAVEPDYPWSRLREEHPLVYENSITPSPKADEWFHAKIVVKGNLITVFVNYSTTPSLQVKKLNTAINGMIGLWDDRLSGDFANLIITQ